MSVLNKKIDFAVLVSVTRANPNGDPANSNLPRTDNNGFGEITDVCIKRKIRNRMQDMGHNIFVQSEDRSDDGCKSLSDRIKKLGAIKDRDEHTRTVCEKWMDVRSFGQVFSFKEKLSGDAAVSVRGPISIHLATSISPVDVDTLKITKSVNNDPGEKKGPDTMGEKHMVRFGLYLVKGSINVQLAEKTGFSDEDAEVVKECLRTLFENDASAARPDGSMEVYKLYWWEHSGKTGQYSSAKVHNSLHVSLKEGIESPTSKEEYDIALDELPGLKCTVIDGI